MAKTLYLIDGHSHCYRAFHAIRGMTAPDGKQPTNAVYGFVSMLLSLIKKQKPDLLGVVFDAPGPTFRHKMYDKYKGTRPPMPDELRTQLPLIMEIVSAYNIPLYLKEGFEADDILGTIAKKGEKAGLEVYLVTGDKDTFQLITDAVKVYDTQKDSIRDRDWLKRQKGIAPEQMIDLLALQGDSTDNVPGVPGVGEKTALKFLKEYGSLEGLYENTDKLKGKQKEKVEGNRDQALLSRKLVTIDTAVDVKVDFTNFTLAGQDTTRLRELFKKLGFKRFLNELGADGDSAKAAAAAAERRDCTYRLVNRKKEFVALTGKLAKQKLLSVDLETTSVYPVQAELVGMSFSFKEKEAYYVPVKARAEDTCLNVDMVLAALKPIYESEKIAKIGQNIKYDAIVLRRYGVELKNVVFDTMIASYLLNPERRSNSLDALSLEHLGIEKIATKEIIGSGKNTITMDQAPLEKVSDYACEDADAVFRLHALLSKKIKEAKLEKLLTEVELPLIESLMEMELTGVRLDKKLLKAMSKNLEENIALIEQEIFESAGHEFNINSPKQLSAVLFTELGLPITRKTKTGASTDSDTLAYLATMHDLPKLIVEYRNLGKLKSTYVDALPALINPKTGRVHASFNQTITATGRLSSSDPNLQNIPIREETGKSIRRAFVPDDKEHLFLSSDYSQIELRLLAHYSKDEGLIEAFNEGKDIHTIVAAEINGIDEDEVTPEQRTGAKAVNFGIIYGLSAYGLSQDIGISVKSAKLFIDSYFEMYPQVKDFIDDTVAFAREHGCVKTILGRVRHLAEIHSSNKNLQKFAERAAVNTVLQGSAADLIKVAMNTICSKKKAQGLESKLLLQIHDELLFEVPKKELAAMETLVRTEMEGALTLAVPLIVATGKGKNWLELK